MIDFWDPAPDGVFSDGTVNALGRHVQKPVLYGTGPTYMPNPWDTAWVNGEQIPGLVVVDGAVKLQIDKSKKAQGKDGITLTSNGLLPGPVDIDITLWTEDQWEAFIAIRRTIWIKPNRGEAVRVVTIDHPAFALWDINQVMIESPSVPKRGPIPQTMLIKLRCLQFLPPVAGNRKKATKTPKAVDTPLDKARQPTQAGLQPGGESPSKTDAGLKGPKKS